MSDRNPTVYEYSRSCGSMGIGQPSKLGIMIEMLFEMGAVTTHRVENTR